ncbi:MAG: hypothetical protein ACTSX7_07805 [Alphaproteobacteria bacterium]
MSAKITILAAFVVVLFLLALAFHQPAVGQAIRGDGPPAPSRIVCSAHRALASVLKNRYGERRRGAGLASSQRVVELYISATGTWTILVTSVEGQSCLLATGRAWQEMQPPTPKGAI